MKRCNIWLSFLFFWREILHLLNYTNLVDRNIYAHLPVHCYHSRDRSLSFSRLVLKFSTLIIFLQTKKAPDNFRSLFHCINHNNFWLHFHYIWHVITQSLFYTRLIIKNRFKLKGGFDYDKKKYIFGKLYEISC